jgi:hypothetical protein
MTRALALISGGLDSILAAKLIKLQGIEVIGICFASAFFGSKNAERMAAQIDMPLRVVDFTEDHLTMTKHPKHGYGKNMNPCIDCHAMMLKYAGNLLEELEGDFLITGEVLDQRPMSQNKKSLGPSRPVREQHPRSLAAGGIFGKKSLRLFRRCVRHSSAFRSTRGKWKHVRSAGRVRKSHPHSGPHPSPVRAIEDYRR